jgi:hypothetical protein
MNKEGGLLRCTGWKTCRGAPCYHALPHGQILDRLSGSPRFVEIDSACKIPCPDVEGSHICEEIVE